MSISDRLDETTEQAARVIGSVMSRWDMDGRPDVDGGIDTLIARALDGSGLLAPSPLREEWAARYTNGGGTVCRTRDEAETELDRMIRDSHRPRIDEPPAPQIAGIYVRHVTDWENP